MARDMSSGAIGNPRFPTEFASKSWIQKTNWDGRRGGIAEGAVFEDAVLAQPQTAALLRRLMEERGLKVE